LLGVLAACLAVAPGPAAAQAPPGGTGETPELVVEDEQVQLDFNDVELAVVIDTIAKLTGKNFIYDDRVRGRVTIVSPTRIPVDQAYAVFESVLQVKGFTTVPGPGGAIKVIPIREAKETSIETFRGERSIPEMDRYITRLIPLSFIDAEAITNTLKPLVSKDAAMVAYPPTNTVILTDSASNINRILSILESIDVETYKEELTVIKVQHADAATMAQQLSEIFGAEVSEAEAQPGRRTRRLPQPAALQQVEPSSPLLGKVRIITDARTNSMIVLASRQRIADIRDVVRRLDVPVSGGGRIHVYYLNHADAEELAETLSSLISGQPRRSDTGAGAGAISGAAGQAAQQALRSVVTELAEGVTVTADPATNSLVVQASQEGFSTLKQVIALLDIARPQVLVEALIMEVDVADSEELGFNALAVFEAGDTIISLGSLTDLAQGTALAAASGGATGLNLLSDSFIGNAISDSLEFDDLDGDGVRDAGEPITGGSLIQGIIRANASDGRINIVSSPNILTSDNEEAEIKVGNNIPIISSRVQSAQGIETTDTDGSLATSVNVERQDIGVTLRVTPQITEGETVRLQIFQEITDVNDALSAQVGDPEQVGVALSNRKIDQNVVVADGETVVIGGLISDRFVDTLSKVPWLGDIPILGWGFKSSTRSLQKINLLVFLTPHIVRDALDAERETIRKREEFWEKSAESLQLSDRERDEIESRREIARAAGVTLPEYLGRNPVRARLLAHSNQYPVERMLAIEEAERAQREATRREGEAPEGPAYSVLAAVFRDEAAAMALLQELVDGGYDGQLVSSDADGEVVIELRLGPYATLAEAEQASEAVRSAFGLSPTVLVERGQP
jgi:general secretion pathway protein D